MEHKGRLLVVEDDGDIRRVLRALLEGGGYEVTDTGDPTQAVALAQRSQPDLILCDLAMPVMDGYGVVRALQADPRAARIPVIFVTARREPTQRVEAFRYGVVDYITKPFTREALLTRLDRVLTSLAERSGTIDERGPAIEELIHGLKRAGRSGVLSIRGGEGDGTSVMVHEGQVVEGHLPQGIAADSGAEFRELDLRREDVARHDPPRLPGELGDVGGLADLPAVFRVALVVDDSETFRGFLREVLERRGFVVHEAASGEEGLRVALQRQPWLIITDVVMPGMDGIDFCRAVRRHSMISHTPLVFLSGWDEYKDRYAGLEAGADEYLSKDTSVRELLLRIQIIMGRLLPVSNDERLAGRIELLGVPGLLQMCHLAQLSGELHFDAVGHGEIAFRDGELIEVVTAREEGRAALLEILGWSSGRFRFEPGPGAEGEPIGAFAQILLEACQTLDEKRRGAAVP